MNDLCTSYWRRTGAKFMGNDNELSELIMDCGKQMALSDEEGYFSSFLCTIDFKQCDKCCNKHNPRLDDWIKPCIDELNKRLENK